MNSLINTHWHWDHTDGNEWVHKTGATIIAHEKSDVLVLGDNFWNGIYPFIDNGVGGGIDE